MSQRKIFLGNEAMAHGLLEAGCSMATSYPGTPASEILGTLVALKQQNHLPLHVEWSINEKVAFEVALANSFAGRRSAVIMKQVGLNVAADPFMSAAYTGVKGGFLVIVADDPGPHSSQTEQDTRGYAMLAKLPVLDPSSPEEARDWIPAAYELSEQYQLPVILRPTTRVCHARQDMEERAFPGELQPPLFEKDPARWAATPKFRLALHKKLNEKIAQIASDPRFLPKQVEGCTEGGGSKRAVGVVASGAALAHAEEILADLGSRARVQLYQVKLPYPLAPEFREEILKRHRRVLVLEESLPVIEWQLQDRDQVVGRTTGMVPGAGELLPEVIEDILRDFLGLKTAVRPVPPTIAGRRPTLCAGCPHRASFFAIKKAFPKGIYPSDIGCYTLGLNLGVVDTVLCMGAAISQAAGFYHAYQAGRRDYPSIVATIGDSTFYHAGVPALINAVVQNARFVLVILDNSTTAMTGNQPTPAGGMTLEGQPAPRVLLPELVKACGVRFVEEGDPYQFKTFVELLKRAGRFSRTEEGGLAVVIAKHPCLMDRRRSEVLGRLRVTVNEKCEGCGFCLKHFECPALTSQGEKQPVVIDPILCTGCGVCVHVCPHKALEVVKEP